MNRNFALAIIVASVSIGNAFAADITVDDAPFVPTLSRAQVQSELAQYRQSGVNPWSTSYNQTRGFQSSSTRAAVVAEYLASRDQVAALTREDSGSAYLARSHAVASTRIAGQ